MSYPFTDELGNEYEGEVIARLWPKKGNGEPIEILLSMNPTFALYFKTKRYEPVVDASYPRYQT